MMTIRRTTLVAVLLACLSAVSLLSVASAESKATKQRVSFLTTFSPAAGTGLWQLIPISPGPLKRDSGPMTVIGGPSDPTLLNGQRVTPISGWFTMTGKQGTLVMSQRLVDTDVGNGYHALVGTWKIQHGTGAYKGMTGAGRMAGVEGRAGTVIINQEGWVAIP